MKRRQFVGGLAAAAGLAACARQDADCGPQQSGSQETFEWSLVTSWPPKLPGLGLGAENLAKWIGEASGGRLTVKVYAAGELVPAFEVFDAVSRGTAQMGHGAAYYHKGKVDAAQFFATVPFGLTAEEMNGWLYYGGGLELWRELYEPFNLVPFASGNSDVQMGGWFNKEINSVDDLKGLKMRIPGLGGEVLRRAGGTPVTLPGSEIFTSLQTGAIDATEWVGPYNDLAFGLQKAAKYYYYPGWHEPGPILECIVNKDAWDALPPDLKKIVELANKAVNVDMHAEFTHGNARALAQIRENPDIELREFPQDVIDRFAELTAEILEESAANDPAFAKIKQSFEEFRAMSISNQRIGKAAFLGARD
ncbi:MAG: TRAP transporter substrate-binding protein [Woeseiaceae bacterium]|nr:TRAP transporter substrate-binding protein [Woeseiaceae bacterium]